jgi:hypothetical protein
VVFIVAAGYSAGGAGLIGYEERLLVVRFDERSIVTEATLEDRVCPRGVVVGSSGGGVSPSCLKVPDLSSGRPPDLFTLRTFYVAKPEADTRDINRLIVAELRRKGLETTTGPAGETPKTIDAVVTYEAVWTTDATGRLDQLTARIVAPGSERVLATATFRQAAHAASKTPDDMVAEVVTAMFTGPGKPFLTLPPYKASLDGALATPSHDKGPVRLEPVRDARTSTHGRSIGDRTALGYWLGKIDISPIPAEVIDQLLRAELAAMGHPSVGEDAEVVIDASVTRFEVRTPSTLVYWDVDGAVAVDLGVTRRAGDRRAFHYEATCTDRTYVSLSESLIKGVVQTCLGKLGATVREDRALEQLLSRQ